VLLTRQGLFTLPPQPSAAGVRVIDGRLETQARVCTGNVCVEGALTP
jgi:hypothetical protein